MSSPVLVWRWADAPEPLRRLSQHGGDEDFLAHFPSGVDPADHFWASEMPNGFARRALEVHELPDGSRVLIGAHA